MPVTVYRSTDTGAPVLTGQEGSAITVLDAILVNGYGAKAGAGWTKAFSGTNKAAYLQGPKTNRPQRYLRVQDDGPGDGSTREARMRGYEAMTDVDTGTGPFPSPEQRSAGIIFRKSSTVDATARPWIAVADHRTIYFFVWTGDAGPVPNGRIGWAFGDFVSRVPGDQFGQVIIGRVAENSDSMSGYDDPINSGYGMLTTATWRPVGHYCPRSYTGQGGSIFLPKTWLFSLAFNTPIPYWDTPVWPGTHGTLPLSNPADGKLILSQFFFAEPNTLTIRGQARGLWATPHVGTSFNDFDVFQGSGELAGRQFMWLRLTSDPGGGVFVEISDTWDSD